MRRELFNELEQKYPLSMKGLAQIECRDGWYRLIDEFIKEMEGEVSSFTLEDQEFAGLLQIKEKFGLLRIYVMGISDKTYEKLRDIEERSGSVCEFCGNPGSMGKYGRWLSTACGKECGGDKWEPITKSDEKKILQSSEAS
jgi:ribosomal protein L37AE/L43A